MADRPILFSAPMVRALLEGRKTQTRRVMNLSGHKSYSQFGPSDTKGYDWHFRDAAMRWHDLRDAELKAKLRFAVGDRLYVRETLERANDEAVGYPADRTWLPNTPWTWKRPKLPAIHMPRALSRLTLLVTDVRVQQLQDCSAEDCRAEGHPVEWDRSPDREVHDDAARDWFRDLWDSLNADRGYGWAANPWVVALSFTVHQVNIDEMEAAHAA